MAGKSVIDTIIAEAGGGGDKGITAASWAIVQRAAARGQTVEQVVKSGFDGYSNPGSGSRKDQQDPKMRARVERILSGVQDGSIPNPVPGADHFVSGNANPGWTKGMKLVATIDGQRYYASGAVPKSAQGVVNASSPKTALAAIERVAPASTPNLPSLRSAYADSLPELPRAQPATPAPRSTLDYVRTSASPLPDNNPSLQSLLTSRADQMAGRPAVSPSDLARGNTPSKFAEMPVGLPQVMPGVSSWDEFYKGITPAPKAPTPATADERVTARNRAATALPSKPVAAPPTPRVSGVSDIGSPYSFKAIDAKLNPRPTTSLSAPMPTIATFQPIAPTPTAGSGYNSLTAAQRNALSTLPDANRLMPSGLPAIPNGMVGTPSKQVASIGDYVSDAVDPLGKRVTVPTTANVPLPRARPEMPSIPASLAQPAQIAAAPTNLGPVNGFLGMPNAVPKDFAVAPNAPLPAPRIDRPGIFGNPNIAGVSIPLPGVFGVLQNATKAMNNASGPFNNGLDNSIYQGLRGGNFSAPGAATARAGGFIYAPKQGGGWINVGRDPSPTPSTPSTFNTAIERIRDRSSQSSSGASASSISG